jgi:hypothetical protein
MIAQVDPVFVLDCAELGSRVYAEDLDRRRGQVGRNQKAPRIVEGNEPSVESGIVG